MSPFYFGEAAVADLVLVILGCLAALWLVALLFDSVPREKPMSRRERERAALEAEKWERREAELQAEWEAWSKGAGRPLPPSF